MAGHFYRHNLHKKFHLEVLLINARKLTWAVFIQTIFNAHVPPLPLPNTVSHFGRNFRSPALKRIHPASKKNATAPPQQTLCVALVKGRDAESDVLVEIIGYPRLCGFFQHPENVRENGRLYFHLFAYVSFYVVSGAPGGLQVMQ